MIARRTYETPVFDWNRQTPLIAMRNITRIYKSAAGEFPILKGIDVDFFCGEFVSVVGRSGSGKSTLVNMITGIDHPTTGSVQVADVELTRMSEGNMSVWRGRNLGIVFQFFQLLPMLSLIENVMLPMDFCNMYPPSEREERALGLLKRVGINEDLIDKLPGAISGGQQQSVAVARALANDPPIIIADEPTGNLDSRTAEDVMALFEELISNGKTILMVTHDQMLAKRTSRTMIISDGEMVSEAVSRAFPNLEHNDMLYLTTLARKQEFSSGEQIIIANTDQKIRVLVSHGKIEVGHPKKGTVTQLEKGQFIDPPALEHTFGRPLRLCAATPATQVMLFDCETISPYLSKTIPTLPKKGVSHA